MDDFWGNRAWANWENQIGKALSPSEYPIIDVPPDHTILHTLFNVDHVPQVPNIGLWRMYHQTSERGEDSAEVHTRAILDHRGRVMVMMTHNTDFGDSYERESELPEPRSSANTDHCGVALDICNTDSQRIIARHEIRHDQLHLIQSRLVRRELGVTTASGLSLSAERPSSIVHRPSSIEARGAKAAHFRIVAFTSIVKPAQQDEP